ncbi:unnamed protein product [Colias eurytheme]|nr:unnamed protein product [Colias eurytheme]
MWKKWIDNKSMGGQERLSTIMRCVMLRRTKQQLQQRGQLACLPQRSLHQRDVTLTPPELNVYQKVSTKQQLQQRGQLACLPQRSLHQRDVTLTPPELNVYQKVSTKQQLQQRGQLACLPQRSLHQRDVTLTPPELNVYQKVSTKQQLQQRGQLACLPQRSLHQRDVTLTPPELNVYQKVSTKQQLQQRGQLACLPQRSLHQRDVTLTPPELNVYQKVSTKQQLQQRGQLACLPQRSLHQRDVTLTPPELNVYQKVSTKQQLQQRGQLACLPQRSLHQRDVTLTPPELNVYQKVSTKQQLQQRGQLACLPQRSLHQRDVTLTPPELNVYQKVSTKQQLQQRGQLACLPQRSLHQRDVTLTPPELNVYQKVLVFSKTLFAQFLHQRAEKVEGAIHQPPNKDSEYAKMHKRMIALQGAKPVKSHEILVLLLRLRQVCCHCGLIAAMLDQDQDQDQDVDLQPDPAGQDLLAELNKLSLEDSRERRKSGNTNKEEEEEEGIQGEGTTAAEAIRSVLSPNNPVFRLDKRSSKIQAVMDCLLNEILPNKGEKAVVVSQWTSVLKLVEQELKKERVDTVTLSGSVSVSARAPLIDALNDPNGKVRVMLLSLCAGGVGLNLCGASHLLLLDPHWNPQLEEQARDRVYRVGQTRHVHIYRFMCVDTVEQSIRKLQEAKLEMAENVLTGARHAASKLTIEDLKLLFNMGPQN